MFHKTIFSNEFDSFWTTTLFLSTLIKSFIIQDSGHIFSGTGSLSCGETSKDKVEVADIDKHTNLPDYDIIHSGGVFFILQGF